MLVAAGGTMCHPETTTENHPERVAGLVARGKPQLMKRRASLCEFSVAKRQTGHTTRAVRFSGEEKNGSEDGQAGGELGGGAGFDSARPDKVKGAGKCNPHAAGTKLGLWAQTFFSFFLFAFTFFLYQSQSGLSIKKDLNHMAAARLL